MSRCKGATEVELGKRPLGPGKRVAEPASEAAEPFVDKELDAIGDAITGSECALERDVERERRCVLVLEHVAHRLVVALYGHQVFTVEEGRLEAENSLR